MLSTLMVLQDLLSSFFIQALFVLTPVCLEVGLGFDTLNSITGHCIARVRTTDLVLRTQDLQIFSKELEQNLVLLTYTILYSAI